MSILPSESDGHFAGYASVFNAPDLSRDRVMPGAFHALLAERTPSGIRLLFQHDPAEPVGIWLDLREDEYGLYCRGALNLDVQRGRELYALIKQGALNGLSIGYKTRRAQRDQVNGGRRLYAIDLWEISLVSFPLLELARVTAVKSVPPRLSPVSTPPLSALQSRARSLFQSAR